MFKSLLIILFFCIPLVIWSSEQNTVTAYQEWTRIDFIETYADPIVIIDSLGDYVVGVRNIDEYGFEIKLNPCGLIDFADVSYSVHERTNDSEFNKFAWGECNAS
jgi:hypothetical protein